jgi:hypothetical protein
VRNRKISAIAALSHFPSGLVFDQVNAQIFIDKITHALENTVSLRAIKDSLGINAKSLFSLVRAGVLKTEHSQIYGMRITDKSFLAIQQQLTTIRDLVLAERSNDLSWHQLEIPLLSNVQDKQIKTDAQPPKAKLISTSPNNDWCFSLVA